MNTNLHDTERPDDLPFDRLADGELSEEKRRELLAALDSAPGGWRRCALAFLEAQCWRETLRSAVGQAFLPAEASGGQTFLSTEASGGQTFLSAEGRQECLPHPTSVPATVNRSPWAGRAGTLLAMAASFLVALGLGSWARHAQFWQFPSAGGIANQVAVNTSSQAPLVAASEPRRLVQGSPATGPWRVVTVSNGQQPGQSFNLPAIERDSVDEQWLRSLPPAIPENVRQALSRTGHQVEQRRELIPVPMQDGRRLLVPVDQVEVHYVGNGTY